MRQAALTLLALLAACSPSETAGDLANGDNQSQAAGPAATISVASSPAGACQARWDGTAMSADAVGERALQLLMDCLDALGGPAAATLDNMPFLRVEAPAATRWPCVGPVLASLGHSGYAQAWLRPSDAREAPDHAIQFAVEPAEPAEPSRIVKVGAGGPVDDDGKRHDRVALRELARARATGGPDDFVIAPSPQATFGDVYQTLIDLRTGGGGVMLETGGGPPTPR